MLFETSNDELLQAAAGDPAERLRIAPRLVHDRAAREEVAGWLGVLDAATDELALTRPGCPTPEMLAELPPGAEADHPHIGQCPLCCQELDLIRALETRRIIGESWAVAPPIRPQRLVQRSQAYLMAAPGETLTIQLKPGATASGKVAGASVKLAVGEDVLTVEVAGEATGPLELVIENQALVRRVRLGPGSTEVAKKSWQQATVRPLRPRGQK